MSGYALTVILEQDGIKVVRIIVDIDEFRVVGEGARLSGAPTAAVRRLSEVLAAYYSAGDSYRPAGICYTLTTDGKKLDQVAVARRVLGVVKGALS